MATRAQLYGAMESQRRVIGIQASSIETDLALKLGDLERVARSVSLDVQGGGVDLEIPLQSLNRGHDDAFIDLGVIGWDGGLLAHAGADDLMALSYAETDWFTAARKQGSCICQVKPGSGGASRLVIATRRQSGSAWWIVAATVDGSKIDALADAGRFGSTGEVFLVDAACGDRGFTPEHPWQDRDLDPLLVAHGGIRGGRVVHEGVDVIISTTWLNDDNWVLAIQQDEDEILSPLFDAFSIGVLVLLVCVFFLVNTTIVTVRHLVERTDRANRDRDSIHGGIDSGVRFLARTKTAKQIAGG